MSLTDTITEPRHTEEMQEIIGAPPSWLLRWGISVFFAVLVLILGMTQLITYPDIIKTQLRVRTLTLPQPVITPAPGNLAKILVKNNQEVKVLQPVAIVESPTGNIVLNAPKAGRLTYAGIIHEGQHLLSNQSIFLITTNNTEFFGEMIVPQSSMGKVKEGQDVMLKLQSYPYQEYGILHGTIKYITEGGFKDGGYVAEVDFKTKNITDMHKSLGLRPGMVADAEIITQNNTLFKRLAGNLLKNITH